MGSDAESAEGGTALLPVTCPLLSCRVVNNIKNLASDDTGGHF